MPSVTLSKDEFARRFRNRFYDPAFAPHADKIDALVEAAWDAYDNSRKSPRTRRAGPGHADPDYELSVEWIAARRAVEAAARRQKDRRGPARVLLINGSPRSEHTCPGEMSKSFRLLDIARRTLAAARGIEVDLLNLSDLAAEYGRTIYPCKSCVSTAMPLCHWPCSCYPNHSLGQVNDWMNELYPRFVAAHGIMIVTPVQWFQAPSALKLLIDRLVCADGGNPDPTSTAGKDAAKAKALELAGWPYPRHLAGRVFSVIVHGDAEGVVGLRRMLSDWLTEIGLIEAGRMAALARYIGYYEPYATSHDAVDADHALHEEVKNAARALARACALARHGALPKPDAGLDDPRPK
jgi:multimeric flavodoxin WrbA